ncbi:carbohydrate ABC transporter permease [Leadbettera azotonutricia]|uniref:Putative glycerol-3-phosphate ABC-transporter, permease component n=1 Tax=Leadbettera azotonutricia (strain ATCC BAA-888 / DSM 13862 / ZAS-9) TaxID=545695 RepID=F5YF76_LEAAZ|nr:sugar ABC transporter permease [Leadbettera azotonutricia]AEF83174.1 putative glycerol-3-phosphate ABC-transporter, permease component [Leadbettera azotonutricia ZAS-9]
MQRTLSFQKAKPYFFLLPILIFAAAFVYYPFVRTFLYSFSRVNFRGDILGFAGLRNFRRLFTDSVFLAALKNTLYLTLIFVPLNLVLSFFLALLATKKRKPGMIYETFFMLPMAVSMAAASQIFKMLLDPAVGILNHILHLKTGWFLDPGTALYGIMMVCLWIGFPFDFLLFLSALRNIPAQQMESAELEGAGYFRKLFYIQIPLLTPTVLYVICTNAVLAMMTSTPVMIITSGQPGYSTETLIFMMYTSGYQSSNYSMASCISLATFALCFGMVLGALFLERRGVHYQ